MLEHEPQCNLTRRQPSQLITKADVYYCRQTSLHQRHRCCLLPDPTLRAALQPGMGALKVRLIVESGQHFNDSAASFEDLQARAQRRCASILEGLQVHVLDNQTGQRLFQLTNEADFQRLQRLAQWQQLQQQNDTATFRVKLLIRDGSPQRRKTCPPHKTRRSELFHHVPGGKRACIRVSDWLADVQASDVSSMDYMQDCPVSSHRSTSSWDEQVLNSIKGTVSKLHFGSRLLPVQNLAA